MTPEERIERLEARLARERATRLEAERVAEAATHELYVTREQVRLLSRVAVAANETEDIGTALVATMDALCAQAGWPAARADVLDADGTTVSRLRHGDLPPRSTRVFELEIRDQAGAPAARLEFFSPVPAPAGVVLLEVLGHVGRQLERSNAELEAFAYAASHDLREPLRTIGGFAQLLDRSARGRLGPEGEASLHYIQDGVARLQVLVEGLLALSRAGRGEAPRDRVDLAAVAEETLQSLQAAIEESGGEVIVGPLPEVAGDAGQLGQVLTNLVANGLKFHGGRRPVVRVEAERVPEGVLVAVTDEGPGVAAQDAERVFEMFRRGVTSEGATPGTGLGLSICRRIVEHHGGSIWVEPGPAGRGSRFCVLLVDREPAPAGATTRPAALTAAAPRAGAAGAAAA